MSMTDPPSHPDTTSGTNRDTNRGQPPGMPRWVKVSALLVGALVLALVAIMVIGGGDHGPSRHAVGDQPTEPREQTAAGDEAPGGHGTSERGRG